MEWFHTLLSDTNSIAHIVLIYAVILTIGLAVVRIKVEGISLGVIGVLFVGLVCEHFGVKINLVVWGFT